MYMFYVYRVQTTKFKGGAAGGPPLATNLMYMLYIHIG